MNSLTTKLHYTYHEDGEFESESKRTLQQTTEVIEHFPWDLARKNLVVGLSTPSVTIQNEEGAYLRISLYYHDKFILYYLDNKQQLYKLSVIQLADAYPYINIFFNSRTFVANGFKQENTIFQDNQQQFATNDFRYVLKPVKTALFFLLTNGLPLLMIGGVVFAFIMQASTMPLISLVFFSALLILPALTLFVFFNHYNYSQNKELILSKGNDIFFFGRISDPVRYNKRDIVSIINKKVRGDRNPLGLFNLTTIKFKDGTEIYIPNILMGELTQLSKFSAMDSIYGFPYIRSQQ